MLGATKFDGPGPYFTRRAVVGSLAAFGALAVAGCRAERGERAADARQENSRADAVAPAAAAMIVYRDPSCGCCEAWAQIARKAGYEVSLVDHPDMAALKRQHGVPEELGSCHTAIVAGYVIEGHVPMEDVKRLIAERPDNVKGIAVPGMPVGSPGMEAPDGSKEPFRVMAFDTNGRIAPFSV